MDSTELLNKIQYLKDKKDATVAMYDDQIKMLTAQLEQQMEVEGVTKLEGDFASAYWRSSDKVELTDQAEFLKFVKTYDAFDLFSKTISVTAFRERSDAGETIPGAQIVKSNSFVVQKKRNNK